MTVTDREGYYAAAMQLLGEDGRAGLRINSLCRRVGVTTGSFHHWFDGWPGFQVYLLDSWEEQETTRLIAFTERQHDPAQRLAMLLDFAVSFPHDAEAAIRSWAHLDPTVADVQRRVDTARAEAIAAALRSEGGDAQLASRGADLAMSVLVGHQQRYGARAAGVLRRQFDELLQWHQHARDASA